MAIRFWKYAESTVITLFLLLSVNLFAEPAVNVSGFVTQAYLKSSHYNFYGESNDGSFDYREIALNLNTEFAPGFSMASQLMSRKVGDLNDGSPHLDFLLLDYRLIDQPTQYWGIRAGRVLSAYGLYSETRDVAFIRPSIIMPQSVYFEELRSLQMSADGVLVYGSIALDNEHWLDVDFGAGYFPLERSVEYRYLGADWPGKFDDSHGYQFRFAYRDSSERYRAGMHFGQVVLHYDANNITGPNLPVNGEVNIDFVSLFAELSYNRWLLSAEYLWVQNETKDIRSIPGLDDTVYPERFYLQAKYRFNSEWDVVARFDKSDDNLGYSIPEPLERKVFPSPYHESSTSWMLGLGWRPDPSWLFRAEYHRIRGTNWVSPEDNPSVTDWKKEWDIFAIQATYRF